jgi:hypothetical protein
MRNLAGVLAIICSGAPALAQSVTLTEKSGRPLTVGVDGSFASGLSASTMSPQAIVEEFQKLCLPDPLAAQSAANASSFGFHSSPLFFRPNGKHGVVRIAHWRSDSADLAIWSSTDDLKDEPIVIDERAYQVKSAYGPFRAEGDQCNLVVMLTSFDEVKKVGELLAATFGPQGKLVVKNTFADGHWAKGDVKINFTSPSIKSGSQPAHLSIQILRKGTQP